MSKEKIKMTLKLSTGEVNFDIVNHPLHGQLIAPKDFSDLINLITNYSFLFNRGELSQVVWRGQSDISWRLDSSLVRYAQRMDLIHPSPIEEIDKRILSLESRFLDESKLRGFHNQNGHIISDLELLALMQHHGADTRLIDFTYNFFTALWFATKENLYKQNESCNIVFGLALNKVDTKRINFDDSRLTIPEILNKYQSKKIFLYQPNYMINRMSVQQCVFAFSKIIDSPNGSLNCKYHGLSWSDKNLNEKDGIFGIAINSNIRLHLATYRIFENLFGYSTHALFPEIDSFAKHYKPNWSINYNVNSTECVID